MSDIQVMGDLRKYNVVEPFFKDDITRFFNDAYINKDLIEDMIYDWSQDSNLNKYILFPINNYMSQINTIANDIPDTWNVFLSDNPSTEHMFLFLEEIDRVDNSELRNTEELSGEGRLITTFELKFLDYGSRFLRNRESNFFKLEGNQVILNSIRLTASGDTDRTLGLKLTGKAAQIAARRKEASNEQ